MSYSRFIFLSLFFFCHVSLNWAGIVDGIPDQLPEEHGILVIRLDHEVEHAVLEYASVKGKKRKPVKKTTQSVSINGETGDFLILELPGGEYQITKLEVPQFDLPYLLVLADDRYWGFRIKNGTVGLFGKIWIPKERGRFTIPVHTTRSFASMHRELSELFPDSLKKHEIVAATLERDDFVQEFLSN